MKIRRGFLWIVAVALVGLCVIGGWLYLGYARQVGEGPAGPNVSRDLFAKSWTDRPAVLVGLGDSVTAGFGSRPPYTYFNRLAQNPTDEFPDMAGINLRAVIPHLTTTNLAVSGSTSFEVSERQLAGFTVADSNVLGMVVVTTGGNDLIHNYGHTPPREEAMYGATWEQAAPWIARFGERLEKIVTEVDRHFPGGCQIFMANIFDPTDGIGDIQRAGLPAWPDGTKILTAYNEAIEQCAARHASVHVVDMHGLFLGHGLHCAEIWRSHYDSKDPHYWYYINLEDPNERGYDAIRRLFLTEMAKTIPASN